MKILVAEDDAPSRLLLMRRLGACGHDVVAVTDGKEGWDAVVQDRPDIAVLDWMMPKLDGIDLCRKIRNTGNLPYVYIIMLTAKGQDEDMITALEAGADDYIVKPFNPDVLRSRVAVGSRLVQYDKELTEKNEQLRKHNVEMRKLVEERSRQLIHAERMATVGLLSAGIAHEINNPTTFISGNVQTLRQFWEDMKPALETGDLAAIDSHKLAFILQEMSKTIDGIHSGALRISKIVNGLKAFCRKDEGNMNPCDIKTCIEHSLELCHNTLKYHVKVEKTLDPDLPRIMGDAQQLEQVLINLFTNAAHAIGDSEGTLSVGVRNEGNRLVIEVGDTGCGIPEDNLNDVWQPFFTTKPMGEGTGLGLSTVLGIIENHSGQIGVENKPEGGALFTITLPSIQKENHCESQVAHSR